MKRIFFYISILLVSFSAQSEEYYWKYISGYAIGSFTSPYYACSAGVASTWFNGKKELVDVVFTTPNKTHAYCHLRLSQCSGTKCGKWYTPTPAYSIDGYYIAAVRYGNGCYPGRVYDDILGRCVDLTPGLQSGGGNDPCHVSNNGPGVYAGNPINFASANKYEQVNLYRAPVGVLEFSVHYNSAQLAWSHTYSDRLYVHGTRTYVVLGDGRTLSFAGVTGQMRAHESVDMLRKDTNEWTLSRDTGEKLFFDTYGRLIKIKTANDELALSYAASPSVITVSSMHGYEITLSRDGYGKLISIETPQGTASFEYYSDKITRINKSTGGASTNIQFHYEQTHKGLLTGITDERGIRYVTWAYDAQRRPILSENAATGGATHIEYADDGSVTVVNPLGKRTKYTFQIFLNILGGAGVKRVTSIVGEPSPNCPASNSNYTYDARGLLATKTDKKGVLTSYTYNSRGLEASRTEAIGTPQARTITTEWHPEFFLPVMITEPDRTTQYTYDTQGRQTSQSVTQR
ncbi:RHS repeat protein [Pseudomonas sp. 8O]|uniref:RHS repeat protein n=1 Tax=Pseudomonas sp. 8O TaxID=2653165 RepID=UPI0012F1D7A9|nr:RHS repeat protein [Pseudomonas sp. 8O]VXC25651.1 RHS repeat protein [Pseudomonas sp. 8O]